VTVSRPFACADEELEQMLAVLREMVDAKAGRSGESDRGGSGSRPELGAASEAHDRIVKRALGTPHRDVTQCSTAYRNRQQ
jgi:hypothetical protein